MPNKSTIEELLGNTTLALILGGAFLVLVAASGGFPKLSIQVAELEWRIALAVLGVIFVGAGLFVWWREKEKADAGEGIASPSQQRLASPEKELAKILDLDGKVIMSWSTVVNRDKVHVRHPDSRVAGSITRFLSKNRVSFETSQFPIGTPIAHLIVLGSPRFNVNAELLQRYFDMPYEYLFASSGEDSGSRILKIVTEHGDELISSRDYRVSFTGTEVDYGVLFLGTLSNNKRVIWIGGIHGVGTEGVFKYLEENASQIRSFLSEQPDTGICWLLRVQYEVRVIEGKAKFIAKEVESFGKPRKCFRKKTVRKPKALICDLGNVVMYFDRSRTYRAIAHHLGTSFEKVQEAIEDPTLRLRQRYECGVLTDEEFLTRLSEVVGDAEQTLPRDLLSEFWGDVFWPNNEMISALACLKRQNVILVLLSNTNHLHFYHVQKDYPDLVGLFDQVVLSYEEKKAKPDQGLFLTAIKKMQEHDPRISVEDILFVDDKEEYINAAHALGIKKGFVFSSYPHFVYWLRKVGLYIP
jgi:FMN phosphatase YigB (HAD superfamily)